MASVQETKDALELQKIEAAELAERSLDAIDTILNATNFWLTSLSIIIALAGLIGLAVIYYGVKKWTSQIASERINSYIVKGGEGSKLIEDLIDRKVESYLEMKTYFAVRPTEAKSEDSNFKKDPKES